MSEMSAEKKKEIENYIIKSYFGGGKNIEAYVNGADLISGSGGIPDLIVEVESFNDEMITVRWDILSEFGSEYKNEFMMVLARERSITRNRCDSVDSMMYAWEAWRSKIQGKPIFLKTNDEDLQKDKCIEELEKEVKALRAEKEVMERHIQELEAHNVSLADTNVVFENELKILTGAIQEWKKVTCCPSPSSARTLIETIVFRRHEYEDAKKEIDTWRKATGRINPEEAKQYIDRLKDRLNKIHDCSVDW